MPSVSIKVQNTSALNVQVQDPNNLKIVVSNPTVIQAKVTPLPSNVVTLNRGIVGPTGPSGESNIGGYPISISGAQDNDTLQWVDGVWTNIPQTEITDGGNF